MDVNDALEGNQPSRPESSLKAKVNRRVNRRRVPGVPAAGDSAAALADDAAQSAEKELPVIPPTHTLDVSSAKIPVSKVNGVISGGNFLADKARIDKGVNYYTLTLRQGAGLTPDRAVQVFLHLKPNEGPTNQSFTVSADTKDPAVPQVVKLWKTSAGFAPNSQPYASNFALKLELGSMDKGLIPGKIFLALADPDKTVVAGQFKAPLILPDPSRLAAQATYSRTATNSSSATMRNRSRYNKK
jgi:hypothetical protein